jgi:hypothetical protein
MKPLAAISIALAFVVCHANAEVKLVREYLLKPPRDPRALFAMATTPQQDLLSLVGNDDGTWRLTRVRRWLDKQPIEESLTVPGLFQGGRDGWSNWGIWWADLLLTPDGNFALCILTAYPKKGLAREDVITVVSLLQFRITASSRISALPQVSGDYREYEVNLKGDLISNTHTSFPRHPGDDAFFGGASHKLAVFALPSLDLSDRCEYSEWVRSGKPVRRENEADCATLLQHLGIRSLDELPGNYSERAAMVEARDKMRPPDCAFLTYSSYESRDGRFRSELCTCGHRGFWGNFIVSHPVESVFLVETGQKLGSIKVPKDHPLQSAFAVVDNRDFWLALEGGTRLTVYEITR